MSVVSGKIYKINVTFNISTGVINPVTFPVAGNAFELVYAPFPLIISTDVSNDSIFYNQTGQAYGGNITNIQIVRQNMPDYIPSIFITKDFDVYIWAGQSNYVGFIDHRIMPDNLVVESIMPTTNLIAGSGQLGITAGVCTVPAGGAGYAAVIPKYISVDNSPAGYPYFNIVECLLTNLDANNSVDVCSTNDPTNTVYTLLRAFPGQVLRIPVASQQSGYSPIINFWQKTGYAFYLRNTNASDVLVSISSVVRFIPAFNAMSQ